MSKLHDITERWLDVHNILQDRQDNQGKNEKKLFYNKKIKIPDYTLSILSNIIKNLPNAPEIADAVEDYDLGKEGTLNAAFG